MVPRKNGKTSFIAALEFAVAILQRRSGSTSYIVANVDKVHPQADVLPGLLGDVAAASIEVTHENEILKDRICNCLL